MGIEVWALVALVMVLAVYLLPFLVGRREVMALSNADDRYSSELRVLATGGGATTPDETCTGGGRAQIFRRRPEVKAMNRPAVRNVRALRTERDLARARRVHEEGSRRRQAASSHRGVVASALVGISLGLLVVAAVTALPWWPVVVPVALLAGSMVAGHRASKAALESERRERRRVVELERRLEALSGSGSKAPVAPQARVTALAPWAEAQEEHEELLEAEPVQEIATPLTVTDGVREAAVGAEQAGAREDSAAETQQVSTATPPQGWQPVYVPAPTYTLAARAPRRSYQEPEQETVASAKVPARPQNARTFSPADAAEEHVSQMIDLDAVLERRRAVGE